MKKIIAGILAGIFISALLIFYGVPAVKAQNQPPMPSKTPPPNIIPTPNPKASAEEVLRIYHPQSFKFDFDGDGKDEVCLVTCKKVKDYSTDKSVKEKQVWYQFHIKITGSKGRILHEDIFSSVRKDYLGMVERLGIDQDPDKYMRKFFSTKRPYGGSGMLNEYAMREINKSEIDKEWMLKMIKNSKKNADAGRAIEELTTGRHMVLQYMGEWAEDLRICVYSKKLGTSVWLFSDYEK